MSFIKELKRRNVFRVGIAYLIVAWLIAQVTELALDSFAAPAWVIKTVLFLLAIGFPLALVLAWAFEMTPGGIKAESDVHRPERVRRTSSQRFDYAILGLVVLAVAFLSVDRFLLNNEPSASVVQGADIAANRVVPSSRGVKRSIITLEDGLQLALSEQAPLGLGRRSLALSPDGNNLVYVVDRGGKSQLYLRQMDAFEAQPIAGTEGAFGPFFSADGQWIGFLTPDSIKKVSIRSGAPQTLTEAGNVIGANWGPDDTIVYAEREGLQLSRISSNGGARQVILNEQVFDPFILPDGSGILLTRLGSVVLLDLATNEVRTLIERGRGPHYVPTGHILYSDAGGISAVPFDLSQHAVTGPAVPVLDDVRRENYGISQMAFSADGWLVYIPGADTRISKPLWVDREGVETPIPLPPQNYGSFRLSPDGSQVALLINGPTADIWLFDFQRATPPRRLTTGGNKGAPMWSPDGTHVVFGAFGIPEPNSEAGIYKQGIDGGQIIPLMRNDRRIVPGSWVSSGLLAYYTARNPGTEWDIWVARPGEVDEPKLFLGTSASEWGPALSPDGHFIAYTSDESGQYQVYVKAYPADETRWTISVGYGEEPLWSAAGDEIFYRRGQEWLRVPVSTDPNFEAGTPQVMFDGPYVNVDNLSYDVAPDAQRFLLLKRQDQPPATRIHVVANWFEELMRLTSRTE